MPRKPAPPAARKAAPKTKAPANRTTAKSAAAKPTATKPKTAKPKKEAAPVIKKAGGLSAEEKLRDKVMTALEDGKGESILCVDVRGRSSFTDFLIIATGRANRHVKALAINVEKAMRAEGVKRLRSEGLSQADWAVVDGGDVIVHVFRPEVRAFYRLEEVWGLEPPLFDTLSRL